MHRPCILVTGGRGFVGSAVVRHLLARGFEVHVFGPESPVPLPAGASETLGSIEDAEAIDETLRRIRPESVLHFAAFSAGPIGLTRSGETDPERMMAINLLGFRRLLEACVTHGIQRVIWTSSTVVLGRAHTLETRLDESAPRHPLVFYGLSKVLAEDTALFYRDRHGLETIGLRIPLMLGPGLWYQGAAAQVRELVRQAVTHRAQELVVPDCAFDAMHVDDTGRLVERLLNRSETAQPIYHVAGFTTHYREIADQLAQWVPGFSARLRFEPPAIVYPLVSQDRIESDTGWRHQHDLRSTLRDMLDEERGVH
jgi:UDP-glucose 4-epimerase